MKVLLEWSASQTIESVRKSEVSLLQFEDQHSSADVFKTAVNVQVNELSLRFKQMTRAHS